MERFKALIKDTWWLWVGLVGFGFALGLLLDPVLLISLPISLFAFIYFGLMRYDEHGNRIND